MTAGKFIKEAREKAGLTQKQIADEFGWTTIQFQSNIERSVSWPPMKNIPKLAKLLRISPRALALHIYEDKRIQLQKEFKGYL